MENQDSNEFSRAIGRLEGKMDAMVASVNGLAASFDSLEKGRLSRLEISFAELNTKTKDKARTTAMWTSFIVSLICAIISGIIVYIFK